MNDELIDVILRVLQRQDDMANELAQIVAHASPRAGKDAQLAAVAGRISGHAQAIAKDRDQVRRYLSN